MTEEDTSKLVYLSILQRAFWLVVLIGSTIATCIIMRGFWKRFKTNATIIGLDVDYLNYKVPFPAVSICDQDPLNSEYLNNYLESINVDLFSEQSNYSYDFFNLMSTLSYSNIDQLREYVKDSSLPQSGFKQIISKIVNQVDDTFKYCFFKNHHINCSELFFPTLTEVGVCYTFNLNSTWLNWPGADQWDIKYQEQRIFFVNDFWNIKLLKTTAPYSTSFVYLHGINDPIHFNSLKNLIWTGLEVRTSFSEIYVYTVPSAKQLSMKQRKCVFADEIKLKYFNEYSFHTCVQECRIERALQFCGCIPFFYNIDERICTLKEMECIIDNLEVISNTSSCGCYLGCFTWSYVTEKIVNKHPAHESHENNDPSWLTLRFAYWPVIRCKREVKFGWIDLLVSFGGSASLFWGYSVLSALEIIYYFTIRVCCLVHLNPEGLRRFEEMQLRNALKRKDGFRVNSGKTFYGYKQDINLKNRVHPFITDRKFPKEAWQPPQPPFGIQFLP